MNFAQSNLIETLVFFFINISFISHLYWNYYKDVPTCVTLYLKNVVIFVWSVTIHLYFLFIFLELYYATFTLSIEISETLKTHKSCATIFNGTQLSFCCANLFLVHFVVLSQNRWFRLFCGVIICYSLYNII